jgi:hypothetical protein
MSNRPKPRRVPKPKGPRPKKRAQGEPIEGEQECHIPSCKNFADKALGGRAISRDSAGEVWNSLEAGKGKVRVCRAHYKEWKKERTDDHDRDYW